MRVSEKKEFGLLHYLLPSILIILLWRANLPSYFSLQPTSIKPNRPHAGHQCQAILKVYRFFSSLDCRNPEAKRN